MVKLQPHVSAVIPTYNHAHLLSRAIKSVLSQTLDNLELIVIDDGSTDETVSIVREIQDERVRLIHFEANHGIGRGRNAGVEAARGDFIAFIDSDDLWLPGKLEFQHRVMENHPEIELLFGDFDNINHIDGCCALGFDQNRRSLERLKTRQLDPELYMVDDGMPEALLEGNFIGTSTVIFRKAVVNRVSNFNTNLSGPEDFEFWWRSAVQGVKFAYTTRKLSERYKDAKSVTAQSIRFIPKYLEALEFCDQTALDHGREDLLLHVARAKRRAWLGLSRSYALEGQRREAWQAYYQSLHYGLSHPGLLYFIAVVIGKTGIRELRALRNRLRSNQ